MGSSHSTSHTHSVQYIDRPETLQQLNTANQQNAALQSQCAQVQAQNADLTQQNVDMKSLLNPEQKPQDMLDPRAYDPDMARVIGDILRGHVLHTALFGLASAGKSSAFNFFVRCIKTTNFIGGHHVGEAAVEGGQFSTQCVREPLCHSYFNNWNGVKGDLLLTDTVGFKGHMDEFRAICYGQMKEIEKYPRDTSVESTLLRGAIALRPKNLRATAIVLFISAEQLINKADAEKDEIVKGIMKGAKEELRVGEYQVEFPLIIVVTKCDKIVFKDSNAEASDLVNQRTAPRFAEIFKMCVDRFGVSKDNIFCMGWLDETDKADFSATTTDPRVLAARSAIISLTEGAMMAYKRFEGYERGSQFTRVGPVQVNQPPQPQQQQQQPARQNQQQPQQHQQQQQQKPNANKNRPPQKGKNSNDDDDQEVEVNTAAGESHIKDYFPGSKKAAAASPSSSSTIDDWIHDVSSSQTGDSKNNNNNTKQTKSPSRRSDTSTVLSRCTTATNAMTDIQERAAQKQQFLQVLTTPGKSKKENMQDFNESQLAQILVAFNAAACTVQAIKALNYNGHQFADDGFVAEAFPDDVKAQYKITSLHLKALAKIRAELLE